MSEGYTSLSYAETSSPLKRRSDSSTHSNLLLDQRKSGTDFIYKFLTLHFRHGPLTLLLLPIFFSHILTLICQALATLSPPCNRFVVRTQENHWQA